MFAGNVDVDEVEQAGDPADVMYCINWKDLSHWHNTWHTQADLSAMGITGRRKLLNYIKLWDETEVLLI